MKVKCLIIFLWPIFSFGQISFQVDSRLLNGQEVHSDVPIAVIDINNDMLDDVVALDNGNHLKVFYQTQNSSEFYVRDYGLVSIWDQFAITAGDIDNDGWKEIFIGGFYDGIKIYKVFEGSSNFLQYRKTSTNFFTQNLSLVDIDGDGFLDLYVNDDDAVPKMFQNEGGLDFFPIEPFDFPDSGEAASGNYGSVFTDFDSDGDLDLYISKCRLGVDDPKDPRRINQLWTNDGDGNFSELASDYGLDIGEQSWVTEFADLDNDGDRDVIMLNHTGGNFIYENNNGAYVLRDMGEDWNEVYEGLQLIVRDFDNDGLKDILAAGFVSKMFWNKGGFVFEEDEDFLLQKRALSAAVGDLNNDGFWDIYASYAEGLQQQNNYISDEIWLNTANAMHFLKLTLKGIESNKDAVGASVKLYGEWGIQDYEVKLGESYGITNSLAVIFGLGSATSYDSLVVRWPTGIEVKYENIDIDKHHIIQENDCVNQQIEIENPSSQIICKDEALVLNAPESQSYEWSTGTTDRILEVRFSGLYQALVRDSSGCEYSTSSVYVNHEDELEKPIIKLLDPYGLFCQGEGILLATQYSNVTWNNEIESSVLYALAGDTTFATLDICDTLRSDGFFVNTLLVDTPQPENDTIDLGEEAVFKVQGENVNWYGTEISSESIGEGNQFAINELTSDSTLFATSMGYSSSFDTLTFDAPTVAFDFPPDNINGGLIFSVNNYLTTLESVVCYTDTAAIRKIQVQDYWGNILHEKEVLITPDDSLVKLDFFLAPASYYLLTTDAAVNFMNLGTKSPRLKRSLLEDSVFDLKSIKRNVTVLNSTGTPLNYYSFYDWKLRDYDLACESERVAVNVIVNQQSGLADTGYTAITVSPNPFRDKLSIEGLENQVGKLVMMDVLGNIVKVGNVEAEIDFSFLEAGTYFLKIADLVFKVVKL